MVDTAASWGAATGTKSLDADDIEPIVGVIVRVHGEAAKGKSGQWPM